MRPSSGSVGLRTSIDEVHEHCGVFTRTDVAELMLDMIGWTADMKFGAVRLLEPACGDGSFVVPAGRRAVRAAKLAGIAADTKNLANAIRGFEFNRAAARRARQLLRSALLAEGVSPSTAKSLATSWVRCEDFLLSPPQDTFTHTVGNPPYMRWSLVPRDLRKLYAETLPDEAARGDLCLAFLWRAVEQTRAEGQIAFLCADRWLRSKYGEKVRARFAQSMAVAAHIDVDAGEVFASKRKVSAYAAITILRGGNLFRRGPLIARADTLHELQAIAAKIVCPEFASDRADADPGMKASLFSPEGSAFLANESVRSIIAYVSQRLPRIEEAGVKIRCGAALGLAEAFVVTSPDSIELDRLLPFVTSSDIGLGGSLSSSSFVVNPWTENGELVTLSRFPGFERHLRGYRQALLKRACVSDEREWYRTIDRIRRETVDAPKILVAGLARNARLALDHGKFLPSNAIYSLRSTDWPLLLLYELLRRGVLDFFGEIIAPRLAGHVKRFDGYILRQVRIPRWQDVATDLRRRLEMMIGLPPRPAPDLVADLYGLTDAGQRSTLTNLLGCSR